MSYEQFRHAVVSRLTDSNFPPAVVNRVMAEIDLASQDYTFEQKCTDLIVYSEGVQPIVKMYIASLAVRNCSKRTLEDYTRILNRMFHALRKPYNQITTNDIRLYLYGGSDQWSPRTKEHIRCVINAFFSWCVDEEFLSRSPSRTIPIIKYQRKKLPPLKQIDLEHFRMVCRTPRERALVDLLYASGIRISEAASLLLDDINWQEHTIHIRHGKGDKERITFFNPESEISLRRYLDTRQGDDPHLFCATRAPHAGMSSYSLGKEIRKVRSRIPAMPVKTTPHTFRRTTATTASNRGMPIEEIQMMLGHSNISTTMQYITVDNARVKMDYNRFMAG